MKRHWRYHEVFAANVQLGTADIPSIECSESLMEYKMLQQLINFAVFAVSPKSVMLQSTSWPRQRQSIRNINNLYKISMPQESLASKKNKMPRIACTAPLLCLLGPHVLEILGACAP
jgi:hypothetical protein